VLDACELNLFSDGNDSSVLLAKVYRKPHIGQHRLVGMLADTIGGILGRLKNGGARWLHMI
jgi:hypothetical protein